MRIVDTQGRLFGKVSLIDLTVVSLLMCLTPLFYYAHGSVTGHFALSIEDIRPTTIIAGTDQQLTIMGTGFDDHSTIQLADLPTQQASFINDARLDLESIPPKIGPGWQAVRVTNGRGRSVIRDQGVYVVWQPEILSVVPRTVPAGSAVNVTITGRYFNTGCAITIGSLKVGSVTDISSTQLRALIVPPNGMLGKMDVCITNPGGKQAVLPKAVEIVSPPRSKPTRVVVPPPAPVEQRISTRFLVTFALHNLTQAQARQLKPGATEYDPNGGAHRATMIEATRPLSWTTKADRSAARPAESQRAMLARILLSGTRNPPGYPTVYFYRGEPLTDSGIEIPFRFGGQDFVGLTMSMPERQ